MPVPDFVLALREKLGHDLLPMLGVTAVVWRDGQILLGRRADTGHWALPSGIVEPGEAPGVAIAREVLEETGVTARVDALAAVTVTPVITYGNGDRAQYTDLTFVARWVAGEAYVADDESLEVGWFAVDGLPVDLSASSRERLALARSFTGRTVADGLMPEPGEPLARLRLADREVVLRAARAGDLPALVQMLADDQLGAERESAEDLTPYAAALAAIDADPAQLMVVADHDGVPVGMVQLSILPGLSRRGATRGLLEGVRVHASHRGTGLGSAMISWTVEECRRRGCALVQLTSDASRSDARRFYERLGFVASHVGMKLPL